MSNISNFPNEDNKNQQTTPEEKHIEKIIPEHVLANIDKEMGISNALLALL